MLLYFCIYINSKGMNNESQTFVHHFFQVYHKMLKHHCDVWNFKMGENGSIIGFRQWLGSSSIYFKGRHHIQVSFPLATCTLLRTRALYIQWTCTSTLLISTCPSMQKWGHSAIQHWLIHLTVFAENVFSKLAMSTRLTLNNVYNILWNTKIYKILYNKSHWN